MTFQTQMREAINTNDTTALQHLLNNHEATNPLVAALGLRTACEAKNLACVEILIPYAAEYFNQPGIPADPQNGKSMLHTPADMLYQLIFDTVVPSNNVELFELFTDLLFRDNHVRQCQVVLVQCFDFDCVDLIDCLLPFVDDLSAVAQYKPQAYAFFEERKAVYQNQRLMQEVKRTSVSSISRKI